MQRKETSLPRKRGQIKYKIFSQVNLPYKQLPLPQEILLPPPPPPPPREIIRYAYAEEDVILAASIKEKLPLTSPSPTQSFIHRVPNTLRQDNQNAVYAPQTVSIGPYHKGSKQKLQAMEDYKRRYLKELLTRLPTPADMDYLKSYIQAVRGFEERARQCYAEAIGLTSDEFVQMMVLDGCFIIELFRKYAKKESRDQNDPIFDTAWMLHSIRRDMILLENQLPLFVLQCLFNLIADPEQGDNSLTELALGFFHSSTRPILSSEFDLMEAKHLLDLLHQSFITPLHPRTESRSSGTEFVYCVKELLKAGIKFNKKVTGSSFLDITFNNGVLEIPSIRIDSYMDTLFKNLIALEQCSNDCFNHITSYAFLMNNLINTPDDVGHLRYRGIVVVANCFRNAEDVLILLNTLCNKDVVLHEFYYAELCEQVNAYYRTRWHRWKETLKSEYFKHPWAVLSSFAATLLLLLTLTGTLFSILSFSIHHS